MNHTPYLTIPPQRRTREHAPRQLFANRQQFTFENRAGSPTLHQRSTSINLLHNFNTGSSQYFPPQNNNIAQPYMHKQMLLPQAPRAAEPTQMMEVIQKLQDHERQIKFLSEQLANTRETMRSRKNIEEQQNLSNLHQQHNSFVTPYEPPKINDDLQAMKKDIEEVKKIWVQLDKNQKDALRESKKQFAIRVQEEMQKHNQNQEEEYKHKIKLFQEKSNQLQKIMSNQFRKIKSNHQTDLQSLKKSLKETKDKIQDTIYKSNNQLLRLEDISISIEKSQKRCFKICYQQYLKLVDTVGNEENKKVKLNERIYYLDSERFLLDSNQYYLLDKNKARLQLTEKHIKLMKENGILM